MEQTKVFVYGTLKQGEVSHHFLEHMKARFIAKDTVVGRIVTVLGRYPGLVPSPTGLVSGEAYEIPVTGLLTLDIYEGTDHGLYERKQVMTTGGECVWAYFAKRGFEPGIYVESSSPMTYSWGHGSME